MKSDILVPISALQHYSYCPRQCALIHQEQSFEDNIHTLRGQRVHARVNEPETRFEQGVRVERSLTLHSERLGLIGKADLVEFLADDTPYPVEYKHGRRRKTSHDDLQLAAQAICLEEMLQRPVRKGAIYHFSSRRRREVEITAELKSAVEEATKAVRSLLTVDKMPPPVEDRRLCRECSLFEICQPDLVSAKSRLAALQSSLFEPEDEL